MKKLSCLLAICTFFGLNTYSQGSVPNNGSFGIHIMPLTLIDYSPRVRVGFEKRSNSHLAYCLELGFGNYAINRNRVFIGDMMWNKDYRFFEIRPEVKFYFDKNLTKNNLYTAAELFYTRTTDRMSQDYYHYDNSEKIIRFDQADYSRDKVGLHIKAGYEMIAFKKLDFDFYLGIGIAWRKIQYLNVTNPVYGVHEAYEWVIPFEKFAGEKVMFHTTLGCKVGLVFQKKPNPATSHQTS